MTSNSKAIKVYVNPELREFTEVSYFVIEEILRIAGWSCVRVLSEIASDIIYSTNPSKSKIFTSAGYEAWLKLSSSYPVEGLTADTIPSCAVFEYEGTKLEDTVLVAHFFLAGILEGRKECVEKNGIPGPGASVWGILGVPIVNKIAIRVIDSIQEVKLSSPPRPFWPNGKSWALAVSHDCDLVFKYRPLNFLKEALLNVKEGDFQNSAVNILKAWYSLFAMPFHKDPYFESWLGWLKFEREVGIRSAYYIGTWSRFDPQSSKDDFRYERNSPALKRLVSQLIEGGWEIGLHFSTLAWRHEGRLASEANRLAEGYGVYPKGARGHLWSLDPDKPFETVKAIQETGIQYDSSFGMNLIHGFRRGVAYPFVPYNPKTGEKTGIWELPPVMMDYSLFQAGKNDVERIEEFTKRVNSVKANHGLLFLDWHEYVLADGIMDGIGNCIQGQLRKLVGDDSCWIATPFEIYTWCAVKRWEASGE